MKRYLAIDCGSRRIGLAVGDSLTRIATPLTTVEARGSLEDHARSVLSAAGAFDFDEFVIGLPLNMDGSEGDQAKAARSFARRLAAIDTRPIVFHDERLSSRAADEVIRQAGVGRQGGRSHRDALAAREILQEFLDGLPAA